MGIGLYEPLDRLCCQAPWLSLVALLAHSGIRLSEDQVGCSTDHRLKAQRLTKSDEAVAIRLALHIEDWVLAERLAALLADVPGLQLVRANEFADVVLVPSTVVSASANAHVLLTPRETEVLALLAEGLSNKAIARHLDISVHTAKFHVRALIDKLDAVGRTDAVAHAARRGVIHL